jgi:hypothetical protein
MTALLLLLPLALLVITQVIALLGMPGEALVHDLATAHWALPWALYAAGAAGGIACLALALIPRPAGDHSPLLDPTTPPALVTISLVTAATVVAGPLTWGRVIGEFHLPHHLVRGVLLAIVLVLYWRYVAVHR